MTNRNYYYSPKILRNYHCSFSKILLIRYSGNCRCFCWEHCGMYRYFYCSWKVCCMSVSSCFLPNFCYK